MGLAALNPLSRLRGAIRGLVTSATAAVAHDVLTGFGTALHNSEGRIVDAVRESEARIRADIAAPRARHRFVEDVVAETPLRDTDLPKPDAVPNYGERGYLTGDPLSTRPVKPGPSLEQRGAFIGLRRMDPPLVGKRRHP